MRLLLVFAILFICFIQSASAHKEWVHQYILKEAYRFLEIQLVKPIPPLWRQILRANNGILNAEATK